MCTWMTLRCSELTFKTSPARYARYLSTSVLTISNSNLGSANFFQISSCILGKLVCGSGITISPDKLEAIKPLKREGITFVLRVHELS